jgi:hypothetical protein
LPTTGDGDGGDGPRRGCRMLDSTSGEDSPAPEPSAAIGATGIRVNGGE